MKKRIKIIVALFVVDLFLLTASVVAYMYQKTETLNNKFIPAAVTCEVNEVFEDNEKTSIMIENTGNVDAYIRVKFVSYWQESKDKGNVVGKSTEMPSIAYDTENWIYDDNNNVYYYKHVVAVNGNTNELLSAPITLMQKSETDYYNSTTPVTYKYNQVVEILAEAIQAKPTNAVVESWGVTLDTDNVTIKSVN